MLIEGAIKFARQGRDGMVADDSERMYNGLSQSKAIVMELISSLRPDVDAELCAKVSSLYTYMYRRMLDASLEKSVEPVDEVIGLLEYERETWEMLMERLTTEARELEALGGGAQTQDVTGMLGVIGMGDGEAEGPTSSLSIEG